MEQEFQGEGMELKLLQLFLSEKYIEKIKPTYFLPYAGFFKEKLKRDDIYIKYNKKNPNNKIIVNYVKKYIEDNPDKTHEEVRGEALGRFLRDKKKSKFRNGKITKKHFILVAFFKVHDISRQKFAH